MKTQYQVLENGKPADCHHYEVKHSWNKSIFDTFEEAQSYAWKWISPYGGKADESDGYPLEPDVPWDYSGYGDTIEIRSVSVSDENDLEMMCPDDLLEDNMID